MSATLLARFLRADVTSQDNKPPRPVDNTSRDKVAPMCVAKRLSGCRKKKPVERSILKTQQGDARLCICRADFNRLVAHSLATLAVDVKITEGCRLLLQYVTERISIGVIQRGAECVTERRQVTLCADDLYVLKHKSQFVVRPEWIPDVPVDHQAGVRRRATFV